MRKNSKCAKRGSLQVFLWHTYIGRVFANDTEFKIIIMIRLGASLKDCLVWMQLSWYPKQKMLWLQFICCTLDFIRNIAQVLME